jgi:CheY-like chemotaxis protein
LRALELIEDQPFDLILSDFRMPVMNGQEFYARVRQSQPDLARRIVFLTGDVVNQETRAFLGTVGNPHLSKPFKLDTIAKVISEMLQGTRERVSSELCQAAAGAFARCR